MIDRPSPIVERLLRAGGAVLIVSAAGMLVAPAGVAALFGLDMGAGGDFMTRRYGAAGTLGLGVALWLAAGRPAPSAVLGGVAGWFFVQGAVAAAGLLTATVTGAAWMSVIVDPALGAGALFLATRHGSSARSSREPG